MTVKSEVPAVDSFARLPVGGPAIITVLEKRYKDAIVRESLLATNSRVSGQNFLTVTLYGPVGYVTVDDNALGEDSIDPTQIAREFEWYLFDLPMRTSLIYVQNKYGPFGFATGIARSGDRCLYAWQHVERPLFVKAGAVGIRLRLCDATASEQELLSVMYNFDVVGYLPSPLWNPYGKPPRVASNLGALSAPVEPELPVTTGSVEAAPTRRVVIREPRPVRPEPPIDAPIVPLPEPGDYEDYPDRAGSGTNETPRRQRFVEQGRVQGENERTYERRVPPRAGRKAEPMDSEAPHEQARLRASLGGRGGGGAVPDRAADQPPGAAHRRLDGRRGDDRPQDHPAGRDLAAHLAGARHGDRAPLRLLAHHRHHPAGQPARELHSRHPSLPRRALQRLHARPEPLRRGQAPARPGVAAAARRSAHRRHLRADLQRRYRAPRHDARRRQGHRLSRRQDDDLAPRRRRHRPEMPLAQGRGSDRRAGASRPPLRHFATISASTT